MDTQKLKQPISLEQVLTSYKFLIIFLILFICLIIIMIQTNSKAFNAAFGYEILITAPILLLFAFLIREIIIFQNNPTKSWLSNFPRSNEVRFIPRIIIGIIIIGLIGLMMMLYIGGIFSDNPPENNTTMILNFTIIILFIIITGIIYNSSKEEDNSILKSFSKSAQDTFALRTKYTIILLAFILLTAILYFINPWGIMTNYGGPVIFFSLFVGIVCAILIKVYHNKLANPLDNNINNMPSFLSFFVKGFYILLALIISGSLIFLLLKMMGLFEQDGSKPETWGHIILNIILFCSMLGIIYKLANAGGFLDKNPLYRLILNTLLYIPCLFVSIINYLGQLIGFINGTPGTGSTFSPPKPFEIKLLSILLIILGGQFFWWFFLKKFLMSKYLKQGGEQFVNQPIQTDVLTTISSYQTLSGSDKFDYRYAISFWIYIDAFPPSTNSSYLKIVPILSYGENPCIKYSSETNTLFVTIKENETTDKPVNKLKDDSTEEITDKWNKTKENQSVLKNINDSIEKVKSMSFGNNIDADGNRIIYKHPDILLQKWNHIVLNYNGGTLDVFYNGKLVKSAIEVVPYMKYDNLTVGSENGVKGNVANLVYFKHPLDILTIHTLYSSLKDINPPCISENQEKLIYVPK